MARLWDAGPKARKRPCLFLSAWLKKRVCVPMRDGHGHVLYMHVIRGGEADTLSHARQPARGKMLRFF